MNELIPLCKEVVLPISLYQSLKGRYFVGYADNVNATPEANAWAGLFNPVGSGILLHVNVITITNVMGKPFTAEIWFNAQFPGTPVRSDLVTPANMAIKPLPVPKAEIRLTSNIPPEPAASGIKIYSQPVYEEATVVLEENGKYIFAPGGSLTVYLNLIGSLTTGRVAFGWWEEKLEGGNCDAR